jgi:hypothetical protein
MKAIILSALMLFAGATAMAGYNYASHGCCATASVSETSEAPAKGKKASKQKAKGKECPKTAEEQAACQAAKPECANKTAEEKAACQKAKPGCCASKKK